MRLGTDQRQALAEMATLRGLWHSGCGWHMGGQARTVRIMEGLERRGLVVRQSEPGFYPGEFHITDAGRAIIKDA